MPTAAAIYARISQDRDGTMLGVERQRDDCEALAERRGWPIAGIYVDNDTSAYSGKARPEYRRLLDDVKARRVDAIVAWHPDRLHRSPAELETFITIVESANIPVETAQAGNIDLSTPSGRLVARQLGSVARYESEHKAARIARKHAELAAAGKPILGGTRPFGMSRDRATIVEPEAELIREAAARVLAGGSIRSIASDWDRRGVVSPVGKPWSPQALRRLLMSARLAGLREHRGNVVKGTWPTIIDRDTLDRLRAVLGDKRRRTTTTQARRYLLSGFLRCGLCGTALVARPRVDKVRRYVCASGPMVRGCGKVAIVAEELEIHISAMVVEAIDSPALADAMREASGRDSDGAVLDRLRADESAMNDLARDHYADRVIGRSEYFAARKVLQDRIAAGQRALAMATGNGALAAIVGGARGRWAGLSFEDRRTAIAAVVEHITIGSGRRGYNRPDMSRVEVRWRV
jgi:DNA invertase Pin-like site-specific DNA recombinase